MRNRGETVLALAALALLSSSPVAAEETWPQKKPIVLIVPFAPGGASDFVARIIGPPLSGELKQSVVVDNRGGASGNIGMEAAAHAAADGYTIFLGNGGTTPLNPRIFGGEPKTGPQGEFLAGSKTVRREGRLVVHTPGPA